jgi:glycosyltransferase involved in cell wall biosynthesis
MVGARSIEPLPEFPDRVIPLLDVPHATVMAIWERALFGVCPSIVPEALGNTVHEGMSRGKAVIGTRPGGHEDMIENERTGLLVGCGEVMELTGAMERLLADPELRERLGQEARISAARFSAEAVAPRIEAFCQQIATAAR